MVDVGVGEGYVTVLGLSRPAHRDPQWLGCARWLVVQ